MDGAALVRLLQSDATFLHSVRDRAHHLPCKPGVLVECTAIRRGLTEARAVVETSWANNVPADFSSKVARSPGKASLVTG